MSIRLGSCVGLQRVVGQKLLVLCPRAGALGWVEVCGQEATSSRAICSCSYAVLNQTDLRTSPIPGDGDTP